MSCVNPEELLEACKRTQEACDKGWEAYDDAGRVLNDAGDTIDEAKKVYGKAKKAYDKAKKGKLMYMILIEESEGECSHGLYFYKSEVVARKAMTHLRARFERGKNWNRADVSLCEVLSDEAWVCEGQD